MKKFLPLVVSSIGFGIIWEVIALYRVVPPTLFPGPKAVGMALYRLLLSGELLTDIVASLWRGYLGLFLGGVAGVMMGIATGRIPTIRMAFSPILTSLRQIPPVALIPMAIVWFGIGDLSKILSIACAVFFPVWLNVHVGAENIPQHYIWITRTIQIPIRMYVKRVLVPAIASSLLIGLRSGSAVAFIMIFVSELAGASSGLGYRISVSHLAYRMDIMIGALAILSLCGACTDLVIVSLGREVFPWIKEESDEAR